MNITIIIISAIALYLAITKIMQRSKIKTLEYKLEKNHGKVNELIVDSKNKIMVLHLEYGTITPESISKISRDFQKLDEKGYHVIVLDKSFDIKQKRLSDDIVTKLKRELKNGISRGE